MPRSNEADSRSPLERGEELASLRDALDSASQQRGRLVVIEGSSGIGKSCLLSQTRTLALARDFCVLSARGGELERSYSFGLALRLLEATLIRATPERRAHLLRGPAALALPLLGGLDGSPPQHQFTDEFALVHGLYWCTVNLAEEKPLAVIIDDLHWADDQSLRFLRYLAGRLEDLPVLLVAAFRNSGVAADTVPTPLADTPGCVVLRPGALSITAVQTLLADAGMPEAHTEELIELCWRATGGNPFYLHELISALRVDAVDIDAETHELSAIPTVRRRIVARLASLGQDALAIARAAAIAGENVPFTLVSRIAAVPAIAAIDAAHRLRLDDLLISVDPPVFSHPIIRSTIQHAIPPAAEAATHDAAARVLVEHGAPPEQVAQHLLAGSSIGDDWASDVLYAAAKAAAHKADNVTAARLLRHALTMNVDGPRAAEMLVDLGLAEASTGETTSLMRFDQALAILKEPGAQARALNALGQTLWRYGKRSEAAIVFGRGAELLEDRDHEAALALEGSHISAIYLDGLNHATVLPALKRARGGVAPNHPLSPGARTILGVNALHEALTVPPAERAVADATSAIDFTLVGHEATPSIGLRFAIIALWLSGHPADATSALDTFITRARDSGNTLDYAHGCSVRALFNYSRGRLSDAAADAQAAVDMMEIGWHGSGALPHAVLAHALIEADDIEGAALALTKGESQLLPQEGMLNCVFFCGRGRLRVIRGDNRNALEDFLEAGRQLKPYGPRVNPALAPWRTLAATSAVLLGDERQAAELINEELEIATVFQLQVPLALAIRGRAMIQSDIGSAIDDLERAAAIMAEADSPLEHANTLHLLGSAYRRAGQALKARSPLRLALDIANRTDATFLEQQIRAELHAVGARPRRASLTGRTALTPRELRIAKLAADGCTNRQIAETLFLTQNTVAWHLKHVFRKLEVDARADLKKAFC